ncbi:dTDP-4-dehydrorhamnose 3,5-epimerase family protein [bacterium]|nr:dTDP-4-dehydrorhamnose 3,5-epimerase family protein [bacterium]
MRDFQKGTIQGARVTPVRKFVDERGWLAETFRHDEVESRYHPVMSYVSLTLPGVTRGPHEHVDQADLFVFLGPGNFKIWLWDNRKESPTFNCKQVVFGGQDNPIQVLVPPGVVHAYRNVGDAPAVVFNYPNQLFMGEGKRQPIDEIRHEDDTQTPFQCD